MTEEVLNLLKLVDFGFAYEGNSYTVAIGACSTADTMNVILRIVRYVVVNDYAYIVDVNTSADDVGGYKYVDLSGLEAVHHIVAFSLAEVAVHLCTVDFHTLQLAGNILHAILLTAEDDNALQVASLKKMLDNT